MEWYVDSWAVRDGLAFASRRMRDDFRKTERSVFIAVPDLDAIPVGRVSTGLSATRANFQAGFRTQDGLEIGFKRLDEVIELVRRAYLAGGIGPGPIGAPVERPSPDVGPFDRLGGTPGNFSSPAVSGTNYLENGLRALGDNIGWSGRAADVSDRGERDLHFDDLDNPKAVTELFDYLRLFAEASLVEWMHRLSRMPYDEREVAMFLRWIRLLLATGLWDSAYNVMNFMVRAKAGGGFRRLVRDYFHVELGHRARALPDVALDARIEESIIFQVPCPLRSTWNPNIRTLSDKLLLATSTLDYFKGNRGLPEFIPSLLASLAIVVQSHANISAVSLERRQTRLRSALSWLSDQMPQLELPTQAEWALNEFAWGELTRH